MKGRSLLAAMIIVVFSMLALGLYMWAGAQRAGLPGYGFMQQDGHYLAVNFGSHIVWLDDAGAERRAVDLADFGVNAVGDFSFFADGDLLLYHRAEPLGVLDNVAAFLRLRASRQSGASRADGFYRCELELERCHRLAQSRQYPARSFRLQLEPDTDIIYLADTADHTLYKLGPEGRELASHSQGFKFPNQLLWHDGNLWLADTNHHRVVQVNTGTERFGEPLQAFTTRLGGHRFPHQLSAAHNGLWVLLGDSAMANGRLQRYSWQGEPLGTLALAQLPDPLAIVYWRERLWVNDFTEPVLRRVEPQTGVSEPVVSATLTELAAQVLADRRDYRRLEWWAVGLFLLTLLGGFAAAWRLEKEQTKSAFKRAVKPQPQVRPEGPIEPTGQREILWLTSRIKRRHWWLARSGWVMAAAMLLLTALCYPSLAQSPSIIWICIGTSLFLLLAGFMATHLLASIAGSKLGVIGESLVLVTAKGERTVARAEALRYSDQFIIADDVAIALGNPKLRFWHEAELKRWVYPRLYAAQKLTPWQQSQYLWRLRHPQMVWPLVLGGVLLLAVVTLEWLI
jgi:hypothetical protein